MQKSRAASHFKVFVHACKHAALYAHRAFTRVCLVSLSPRGEARAHEGGRESVRVKSVSASRYQRTKMGDGDDDDDAPSEDDILAEELELEMLAAQAKEEAVLTAATAIQNIVRPIASRVVPATGAPMPLFTMWNTTALSMSTPPPPRGPHRDDVPTLFHAQRRTPSSATEPTSAAAFGSPVDYAIPPPRRREVMRRKMVVGVSPLAATGARGGGGGKGNDEDERDEDGDGDDASTCPPHPAFMFDICVRCGERRDKKSEPAEDADPSVVTPGGRTSMRYIHEGLTLTHATLERAKKEVRV